MRDDSTSDRRVPGLGRERGIVFGAVLIPLLVVYSITAQWSLPYHIDALTNAITGWYVGNEGTLIADQHEVLTEEEHRRNLAWFVDSPAGPVSQYPPGAALWAGFFYAVTPGGLESSSLTGTNRPDVPPTKVEIPPLWPATLSAVVATALTSALLAIACFQLTRERRSAIAAGLAFGVATTAWTVASRMSWTHGVGIMAIAAGLVAVQHSRWFLGGVAFSLGILTRPHIAVVVALIGIGTSLERRQLKPVLRLGIASGLGLAALLLHNFWIWEKLTISGGYSDTFSSRLLTSNPTWFLTNVWGGLFDTQHGLFMWAPFLLVLVAGVFLSWRQHPDWSRWAALGGIAYLLVQWRANRFSGGGGHFAYRYPLEMLTAATPLLYLAYTTWVRPRKLAATALSMGLIVSVIAQLTYAF